MLQLKRIILVYWNLQRTVHNFVHAKALLCSAYIFARCTEINHVFTVEKQFVPFEEYTERQAVGKLYVSLDTPIFEFP